MNNIVKVHLYGKIFLYKLKKQIKGIVGFKIKVAEVQAAYKLSQNHNEMDYAKIINKLHDEETPDSKKMAELMEKRF